MHELKSIALAAERLRRKSEPFLTATVVRVKGSSYRRPGARMLVTRDRWVTGSVSGGCLEDDVLRRGWWRTRAGGPHLVTYDARSQEELGWGLGIGCDGVVDVLLEPAN
ncbi:MAG TPA: XdhC family protein, partial [Polyangiaceae bacterium]